MSQTATADEERRIVVRAMKLGLASYAVRLAIRERLDVTYLPPAAEPPGVAQRPHDPWNFWVFRIGGSAFFQGESRQRFTSANGSVRATRITDDWKLRFSLRGSRSTSSFTLNDGSTLETVTTGSGGDALVVWSIGPRWSVGMIAEVNQSDRLNLDLASRVAPGIEFNVFPYTESTRRQLTVLYELGASAMNYADTTVFGKLAETVADQRLQVSLLQREPWGSSSLSFTLGSSLHDVSKNRLVLSGGISVRVVRGLDVNVNGSYSRVRDQIYLAKAGATDEEVLLRLRQLQTSYRYVVLVGLSYTFGSIFNNIVNPRFGNRDSGGEGVVIFF